MKPLHVIIMSGRNQLLYCTLTLIAMQGHQQSIDKRHDDLGLQIDDEGNIQVMVDGC